MKIKDVEAIHEQVGYILERDKIPSLVELPHA